VYRIASVCNARGLAHPMIISESGRAITAHHSVLVFNTLGAARLDRFSVPDRPGNGGLPSPVADLYDAWQTVSERRLVECWHDAQQAREQLQQRAAALAQRVAQVGAARREDEGLRRRLRCLWQQRGLERQLFQSTQHALLQLSYRYCLCRQQFATQLLLCQRLLSCRGPWSALQSACRQ
jgi:arginine decarboxylase-like protein